MKTRVQIVINAIVSHPDNFDEAMIIDAAKRNYLNLELNEVCGSGIIQVKEKSKKAKIIKVKVRD
jgi:hypothetical protein